MEKYIKIDWPESQKWMGKEGCYGVPMSDDSNEFSVFVPETLYNLAEGEKSKDITRCPYCSAAALSKAEDGRMCCNECERLFDAEDVEREDIRHRVSCLLNGTDEAHPRPCEIHLDVPDACGLSSLEMPEVTGAFEVEGEGTIWFYIYGMKEPMNFDELDLSVLRQILSELEQ